MKTQKSFITVLSDMEISKEITFSLYQANGKTFTGMKKNNSKRFYNVSEFPDEKHAKEFYWRMTGKSI